MFVSTVILPLLLAATPTAIDRAGTRCPKPVATPEKGVFSRLVDLPPAEAFKAVWRSSECTVAPVLARDKIGPVPRPRR